MQFLIYFAVVGSILLSVLFFSSSTQKRPAEDRFFAELKKTETSRPHSAQRHATKPAPAPEMTESAPEMATATPDVATAAPETTAAAPDVATAPSKMATTTPDVAATAPDVATATPDVAVTAPDVATATPDVAAPPSEMATATPDVAMAAPDTTSAPVVAGQPTTHLVPKVVTNARAEAAPKNKRVARKYPRDADPRNPIWWLWGLSDPR
jgi:cytoskeletal protein RodZ